MQELEIAQDQPLKGGYSRLLLIEMTLHSLRQLILEEGSAKALDKYNSIEASLKEMIKFEKECCLSQPKPKQGSFKISLFKTTVCIVPWCYGIYGLIKLIG